MNKRLLLLTLAALGYLIVPASAESYYDSYEQAGCGAYSHQPQVTVHIADDANPGNEFATPAPAPAPAGPTAQDDTRENDFAGYTVQWKASVAPQGAYDLPAPATIETGYDSDADFSFATPEPLDVLTERSATVSLPPVKAEVPAAVEVEETVEVEEVVAKSDRPEEFVEEATTVEFQELKEAGRAESLVQTETAAAEEAIDLAAPVAAAPAVAAKAVAAKAANGSTTRRVATGRSQVAKGFGFWKLLPLLLLPLLGWALWRRKRRQANYTYGDVTALDATDRARQRTNAVSPVRTSEPQRRTAVEPATTKTATTSYREVAVSRDATERQTTRSEQRNRNQETSYRATSTPEVKRSETRSETKGVEASTESNSTIYSTNAASSQYRDERNDRKAIAAGTRQQDSTTYRTQEAAGRSNTQGNTRSTESTESTESASYRENAADSQSRAANRDRNDRKQAIDSEIRQQDSTTRRTEEATGRSNAQGNTQQGQSDDFTRIRGLNRAGIECLHANGIYSFQQLRDAGSTRLQTIFRDAGPQFRNVDTNSWTRQAEYATRGDWNGLSKWQSRYTASTQVRTSKQVSQSVREGGDDDLTKISGIGPATARYLRGRGITRFEQIAIMSVEQLEEAMEGAGSNFQLVDPATWPQQAKDVLRDLGGDVAQGAELMKEINEIKSIQNQQSQPLVQKQPQS